MVFGLFSALYRLFFPLYAFCHYYVFLLCSPFVCIYVCFSLFSFLFLLSFLILTSILFYTCFGTIAFTHNCFVSFLYMTSILLICIYLPLGMSAGIYALLGYTTYPLQLFQLHWDPLCVIALACINTCWYLCTLGIMVNSLFFGFVYGRRRTPIYSQHYLLVTL